MDTRLETRRQLFRYAVTGLVSNCALYACYVVLTSQGTGHKSAMTAVYCTGVAATFVINRRWTFDHTGMIPAAVIRYAATHAFGYLLNAASLILLVDIAGLPHRLVMLTLIFVTAGLIFLLQRYWVFPAARERAPG